MEISNLIKGQISQTLMKILFERAGYRVVRLGVEELFQEIVHLSPSQYGKLGLPKGLRYLPDLLISDLKMEKAFLVEVKYRREITQASLHSLREKLLEQCEYWPEMHVILLNGSPRRFDSNFHQDYIRIIGPGDYNLLLPSDFQIERSRPENIGHQIWEKLPTLNNFFDGFHWKNQNACTEEADFIAASLRELASLGK